MNHSPDGLAMNSQSPKLIKAASVSALQYKMDEKPLKIQFSLTAISP